MSRNSLPSPRFLTAVGRHPPSGCAVIWDWWNIETKGQYAASCLVVILAVVLYRGLVKLEAKFVTYALALATQADANGSDLGASTAQPACNPRACLFRNIDVT